MQQGPGFMVINSKGDSVALCCTKQEAEIIKDSVWFVRMLAESFPALATRTNQDDDTEGNLEETIVKLLAQSNGLRNWYAVASHEKKLRDQQRRDQEAYDREQEALIAAAALRDGKTPKLAADG